MSGTGPNITSLSVTTAVAIGHVYEQRKPDGKFRQRTPDVFFNPGPDTGYEGSRHEGSVWVTTWCKPHKELLDAWALQMGGHPIGTDDYSIGELRVRRWHDGRLIIVCSPRSHIGSLYFECSDSKVKTIEIVITPDTNDYEIRENIKGLKREITRRQVERRTTHPLRSPEVS